MSEAAEQQLQQLLGLLEVPEVAAKHGVDVAPASFRKPNAKGLELVLFQLYAAIYGENRATKEFKGIWPVTDRNQAKEFNQKVTEWFKELRDKHQHLESLTSMTVSQLRSASGHRIVNALLELATLALLVQYQRLAPAEAAGFSLRAPAEKESKVLPALEPVLRDLAMMGVQDQVQRFLRLTQQAADLQGDLDQAARDLKDQFYGAKAAQQRSAAAIAATTPPQAQQQPSPSLWQHYHQQNHPGATPAPPPPLLPDAFAPPPATQAQLAPLAPLDAHLGLYADLAPLLRGALGGAEHPHAIRGDDLLRHASSAPFSAAATSQEAGAAAAAADGVGGGPAAEVDLVEVMDDWVAGLEQLCGSLHALVGDLAGEQGGGSGGAQQEQPRAVRGGASAAHPLLAPAEDVSGHAAMLATQLRLHREGEARAGQLVAQLRSRVLEADERLQRVQPQVAAAMHAATHHHAPASGPVPPPHHAAPYGGLGAAPFGASTPAGTLSGAWAGGGHHGLHASGAFGRASGVRASAGVPLSPSSGLALGRAGLGVRAGARGLVFTPAAGAQGLQQQRASAPWPGAGAGVGGQPPQQASPRAGGMDLE